MLHDDGGNPTRGGKPKLSLCGNALAGRFGLQRTLINSVTGQTKVTLCDLSRESDLFSGEPRCLAVNLGLIVPIDQPNNAALDIFARLFWTTGQGRQSAEIDIPASGTTVSLVGADGLQVEVFRNASANTADVDVVMSAGFSTAPSPQCAQRTVIVGVLPLAPGVRFAIPAWSKGVTVVPNVFGALGAPGGRLNFFSDRATPAVMVISVPVPPLARPAPIPNDARFFDVVGIAGAIPRATFNLSI